MLFAKPAREDRRKPERRSRLRTGSRLHHLGRELEALGHRVRLLPPSDVARYRDGNKTDRADAIAILEASRNERIDPVPVKTVEQQALTSLHRLRSAYVADRTARINTVRGILREFGHTIPQGARTFVAHARIALDDEQLPPDLRDELGRALDEIVAFRKTITEITGRIDDIGARMPAVAHLRVWRDQRSYESLPKFGHPGQGGRL